MDELLRRQFAETFGRQPNPVEVADLGIALSVLLYLKPAGLSVQQIQQRLQQMLTPGTPLYQFLASIG
jgi:hypothetical protein